jgi:hypothetical protein
MKPFYLIRRKNQGRPEGAAEVSRREKNLANPAPFL